MLKAVVCAASLTFLIADTANAGPKEEAQAAIEKWAAAFNAGNAEQVTALFRADALVWGTAANELASTPDQVRGYFVDAFKRPITVALKSGQSHAASTTL